LSQQVFARSHAPAWECCLNRLDDLPEQRPTGERGIIKLAVESGMSAQESGVTGLIEGTRC